MKISSLLGISNDINSDGVTEVIEWLSNHGVDIDVTNMNLRRLEPQTDEWYKEIDELREKGFNNIDYNYDGKLNKIISFEEKLLMIKEALEKNSSVILALSPIGGFTLMDNDGKILEIPGGHYMCITDISEIGFVVSSWGEQYVVPFSDAESGRIYELSYE